MGAADIVPGVSGGTIAFITGIYEELLRSIKSVLPAFLRLIKRRDMRAFWRDVNGAFLLTLFAGILTSVVLFAKLITYLLAEHPIPVWSFFFGLIVASVFIVARQVDVWRARQIAFLILGIVSAWLLTSSTPSHLSPTLGNAFLSGFIAICAMILPGISGSFVLLILGTYTFILGAVHDLNLLVMSVFACGCVAGLLSIANILSWAFVRFRLETLALLTGFMLGALNKVWPWKEVLSFRENSRGELVPLLESNIWPLQYEQLTGASSQLWVACLSAAFACLMVFIVHRLAESLDNQSTSTM